MKYSEAKKEITKQFTEKLKPLGFKKRNWYTYEKRIDDDFAIIFSIAIYDYGDYPYSFNLGITSKKLSNIYNKIFDTKLDFYQPIDSIGIYGFSQEILHNNNLISKPEFVVENKKDISFTVNEIVSYITEKGIFDLTVIANYMEIEKIKNNPPFHPRQGDLGVILAKLVGNPNIEYVISQYANANAPLVYGDTQIKFNMSVDFTRNHTRIEVLEIAGLDHNLKPIKNGNSKNTPDKRV